MIGGASGIKIGVGDAGIVARYGGEEFAVILSNMAIAEALRIAEQLRQRVEAIRVSMRGIELATTISIGAASFPEHALDPEELIRLADQALYQAKRQGRNSVCSGV